MWTADELARVRDALLALLRELDHAAPAGDGPTADEDVARGTADATEVEELAARLTEEDVSFRVLALEGHLRAEVADALARLDAGRYGACEGCGRRVAKERLRALPYARWCMPCARRAKGGG